MTAAPELRPTTFLRWALLRKADRLDPGRKD
jgi:hypothetical protein